jgi:predicted ATPase
MNDGCRCTRVHTRRRIVLTGGPGAGKTAVLEMLSHELCSHVVIVREAAAMLFGGGFPRSPDAPHRRAAQRAIFAVQLELETIADIGNPALVLCDRGVVDGFAYWSGPGDFWSNVGMTRTAALARYDAVIHLRTPGGENGYGHQNPLRTETAAEAQVIDERIAAAWEGHARRYEIPAQTDFLSKARQAIEIINAEVPDCCRRSRRVVGVPSLAAVTA